MNHLLNLEKAKEVSVLTVMDPVCGMEVNPDESNWVVQHSGRGLLLLLGGMPGGLHQRPIEVHSDE